mmetsp:Transcript_15303/g.41313  ORF Transcript_15303/g.41313 Transcript_15303/m.41313 type:complete len:91 (+) Transcript_15303:377-649(+)
MIASRLPDSITGHPSVQAKSPAMSLEAGVTYPSNRARPLQFTPHPWTRPCILDRCSIHSVAAEFHNPSVDSQSARAAPQPVRVQRWRRDS